MSTGPTKKLLVFLAGINAPPLTTQVKRAAGFYLNQVQDGESLSMPISRPMASIGPRVHELRLSDEAGDWRVMYRIDEDCVVVIDVFKKTTKATPNHVIDLCQRRLALFDAL